MPRRIDKPREGYLTKGQRRRRGRQKESYRAQLAHRLARRLYFS